jgi:L-threonate 2-dehydrogenase
MSTRSDTIAVIGTGEMGAAVGRRMREAGARVLTTLAGRGAASIERVKSAQLEVIEDDDRLARDAGFILSIVPPGVAHSVAERFRAPIECADEKPVFVDCNAVSPATVHRIAAALAPSRCSFIDAGIIGGPPRGSYNPRFYASGPQVEAMTALRKFGLDIAVLDDQIGTASGLKMSYAGLSKGFIAIGAAMIAAASRNGLGPALKAELERTQPQTLEMLRTRVPAIYAKAYRWVAEMEEIGAFLDGAPNGENIYQGIARFYEQIAKDWEDDKESSVTFKATNSFFGK